ncbi:MAG: class I SAM-dependent methyltransferase [Betaproteobacteria bacterium]|nr:class I SAM-dependent methyltransferase [Betaproteobacteria bacterium]
MKQESLAIIDQIVSLPNDWHQAGSVNRDVLLAIVRYSEECGGFRRTAETGVGRTTLLFSHLSDDHVVFALDGEKSLSQTKCSSLLRAERVRFVEGPSQRTLPQHLFEQGLQAVLIDGPHGYPFPDIEYYYFYPHLAAGGILIIDDIDIPSIGRMLDILRADSMFEFREVVGKTAFLTRTHEPAIDPCGDSWWLQGYNRGYYEDITRSPNQELSGRFLRRLSRFTPQTIKNSLSRTLKRRLRRFM